MKKTRSYSELIRIPTFEERFQYLRLDGKVADPTFEAHRYLNQRFYQSYQWKEARQKAIIRDMACDLAIDGRQINKYLIVHHINPITIDDILNMDPSIFDLDNLICVTQNTHNAIHFSDENILSRCFVERTPGDTKLW